MVIVVGHSVGYGVASTGGGSGGLRSSPTVMSSFLSDVGRSISSSYEASSIKGSMEKSKIRRQANLMDYEGQAAGITPMRSPNYNRWNNSGGESEKRQLSATNVGGKIIKLSPSSAEISQSNAADGTYD